MHRRSNRRRRRGTALIVTLAVLAVLALLAIAMARLTSLERDASRNEVDALRARLAAEAGVEFAVAHLRDRLRDEGFLGPRDDWFHAPGADGTYEPLSIAARPSLAAFDDGSAGFLPAAPDGSRASFRLRILDTTGMLFVGGLDPAARADLDAVAETLRRRSVARVLGRLASLLGLDPAIGDRVMLAQPLAGWSDKRRLQGVLTRAEYATLVDHVTCRVGLLEPAFGTFDPPAH